MIMNKFELKEELEKELEKCKQPNGSIKRTPRFEKLFEEFHSACYPKPPEDWDMSKKGRVGSSFEDFLKEEEIADVTLPKEMKVR